ncbi:peroxiredoxin family protein [Fredinandcohnia humi]
MPVIQIGNLAIMMKWILLGVAVIIGLMAARYWLARTQKREHFKEVYELLSNSIFLGVLIWKFSLIVFEPKLVLKSPMSLLYFTGGKYGILLGIGVIALYVLYQSKKKEIQPNILFHSIAILTLASLTIYHILALFLLPGSFNFYFSIGIISFFLFLVSFVVDHLEIVKQGREVYTVVKKTFVLAGVFGLFIWAVSNQLASGNTYTTGEDVQTVGMEVGISEGKIAPDFTLRTTTGENIQLSSLRGKMVILNFWATWCPPCKAEMPHMQDFYEEQMDQKATVLAVNLTTAEKNSKDLPKFIKEYGLTFPILLDEAGDIGNMYQAFTIPTSYVIDSNGIIQKKIIGPMDKEMMYELVNNVE